MCGGALNFIGLLTKRVSRLRGPEHICLQGCWLATDRVGWPPPSLSLSLFIFQLWSLHRTARSIRIDCPWRAAPLSSQCQPVCDREGEKWRKISAALAVSFPHTWAGRLPADGPVRRGGVESAAARRRNESDPAAELPSKINQRVNRVHRITFRHLACIWTEISTMSTRRSHFKYISRQCGDADVTQYLIWDWCKLSP